MKKVVILKVLAWCCLLLCRTLLFAQTIPCGTDRWMQEVERNDPSAAQRLAQNWTTVQQYIQTEAARGTMQTIITIPVVFHVIHSGQAEGMGLNISDAQIHSQIEVLNNCFRRRNADTAMVPAWFKDRVADVGVEFCLATTDPQGNPTTGITRSYYPNTANFDVNVKPYTQWDPTHYLNIWSTVLSGGILGYSTPPNFGPPNQDGVVLDYRHVGSAPANPFPSNNNLGRTAVHEVGHWLGLLHIFQDSCAGMTPQDCALAGDRVCDTPPAAEATYGSSPNLVQNTCHEVPIDEYDMWMNYMDYVDDQWLLMFTYGQRDVMRAVLQTSRLSIQSSLGCTNTALAFTYSGQVVDAATHQGIADASVLFDGAQDFETTTDANGNFTVPGLYEGFYDVYAGKWGYRETLQTVHELFTQASSPITIPLRGHYYYDDFIFNYHWTTSATASSGHWVRDIPVGTFYQGAPANPAQDVPDDFGLKCFVTGNNGGGADADDVDNGSVTLISPQFDLSAYADPYIRYKRWFYDGALGGNSPDDMMTVKLNNGSATVVLETLTTTENEWTEKSFRVSDFIAPTAAMRFIVEVNDVGNSNIVEGAIDKFEALEALLLGEDDVAETKNISVFPNPSPGYATLRWAGRPNGAATVTVRNVLGAVVFSTVISGEHLPIDFRGQPDGLYLITLNDGYSEKGLKFIVHH